MILSIIIPVYNVRDYIVQCLESIESQPVDKKLYEVIIVNDGTPDDSIQVATPVIERMPNARVINQENQGLSMARNNGFAEAKGEYVWFVDSDDWLLPNALEDVFKAINNNPTIDVFSSRLLQFFEASGKTAPDFNPTRCEVSGKEYLQLRYNQGAVQRFIFNRSFLLENKLSFYPGILHEDGLFGYKMLYYAKNVNILGIPVYAYRIRQEGSIMSNITMRTPKDLLFIHKELMSFCNEEVLESDRIWYRQCVFLIVKCIFDFSVSLAFNKEYEKFINDNKHYLFKETDLMINQGVHRSVAIRIRYYALLYMRLKYIAKKYIKR